MLTISDLNLSSLASILSSKFAKIGFGRGLPAARRLAAMPCRDPVVAACSFAMSSFVARRSSIRRTCSSANTSACASGIPAAVRRLTKAWVSKTVWLKPWSLIFSDRIHRLASGREGEGKKERSVRTTFAM